MTKKPRKASRSPGTILVVDQEAQTRKAARRLLESQGYRVLDAGDPAEAEQIAKLYVGPIHVLLIEVDLPKISGRVLADRLGSLHPELRVLFLSRRAKSELVKQGLLEARSPLLRKPLGKRDLALLSPAKLRDSR